MSTRGPHLPWHPQRNPGGHSVHAPGRSMMAWNREYGSRPMTWPPYPPPGQTPLEPFDHNDADAGRRRQRERFNYDHNSHNRSTMSTHYADEAGLAEMLRRLMESFDSCYFEGCEYDEDEQLDYAEPPVDDQPHDLPWQPIQTPQLDEWTGLPLRGALRPGLAPPRTAQTPARPPVGAPAQRPAQRPAPTPAPQQPGMGQPVMINRFPVYPGMPGYPQNPTQSSRYGNTFDPVYYAGGVFERTPPGQPAKPRPSDSADWMQQLSHLSDWFERASIDSARGGHTHNLPDGYWNSPEHPFGQFQQLWGAPWGNRLRGYHPDGVGHLDESQMVGDVNAAFDFTHDYPMPGWEEMGMGEGDLGQNIEQIGDLAVGLPPPPTEAPGLEFDFGPDDDPTQNSATGYANIPERPDAHTMWSIIDLIQDFFQSAEAVAPHLADQFRDTFGHPDTFDIRNTDHLLAAGDFAQAHLDQANPNMLADDEAFWTMGGGEIGGYGDPGEFDDLDYSRTNYVHHKNKPDSVTHPNSGFKQSPYVPDMWKMTTPDGMFVSVQGMGGPGGAGFVWDSEEDLGTAGVQPSLISPRGMTPEALWKFFLDEGVFPMPWVEPPPLEELDLPENYSRTDYLEHWSKPKTFMDIRLGMFPQRGWLGTEWWSAHPEDQGLMVTAFPTPSTGTRGYHARVSQVVPDGVEDVWRSSATGMTPEDLYREMLAEGLLPRVPAEWEHITEDVGGPHEQMYAAHYDYPADPNAPEGFVPDPVYPPGIFPPEAGPPAGFGAGFPPMQPYGRTIYADGVFERYDPSKEPKTRPSDGKRLNQMLDQIRQWMAESAYMDGFDPQPTSRLDDFIGLFGTVNEPLLRGTRFGEYDPDTHRSDVMSAFDYVSDRPTDLDDDQPDPDGYARTNYLAHPERPDRHDHHNSEFSPVRLTAGHAWTNEGLGGVPRDPNGIITEISRLGAHNGDWGYTSYLPYVPGQPVEMLDEQEGFPSKEELYRHLLTSGVISRQDIPPPAFEDLDLNRGMGQPTQYLPYAGVFERYDPSNPGKVAGVPGDLAAWHEAWGGHDLTQPHRLQGAFEDAMTRWFPEENPTGYGDPIFDVDPEPIPPTSGIWDDIYADRNDQRHQQAAQAGTAWLGDGPRNFGFLRTGRRSGSATPMMPGFGPTGYAYGFDQNDMWSNPMSGTPQPQQQSAVYPYPGTQAPQGMYPGDQMPGQMQGQPQQPMAGMPSAPATNPASMNPPNGQQVMPAQPPAPTFDQTGRPMAEMYDDSVDYNEECMYGPSTPEEWEAEIAANPWDGTGHAAFADWLADQPGMEEEADIRRLFSGYVTKMSGSEAQEGSSFDVPALLELFRGIYADAKRNGWLNAGGGSSITGETHYADLQPVGPEQEFEQPLGTYTYPGPPNQGF